MLETIRRVAALLVLASGVAALVVETAPALAQAKRNDDGVAVVIGNRAYKGQVPAVEFAHNDAEAVKRWILDVQGFRPGNVIDLRDASQAEMLSVFGSPDNHRGKLFQYVRPGESDIVVFYSGHGMPGLRDKRGFLLPVDANPDTVEINGYPVDALYANLGKLQAKSVLVLLDACFSGDTPKGALTRAASGVSIVPTMPTVTGAMTVITAARGDQLASWDETAKHGLFTEFLLRGVYGAADSDRSGDRNGVVTARELKAYLDRELTYAARRAFNRDQNATVQGDESVVLANFGGAKPPVRPSIQATPASRPPASAPGIGNVDMAIDAVDREMVANGSVRLRAAPDVRADVVATLPAGAKALIVGKLKGTNWYAIEKDGRTVYAVSSSFDDPRIERRAPAPPPVVVVQPAPQAPSDPETALWQSVRDSRDAQAIRNYIRQYPTGRFVEDAWGRLRDLNH